MSGPQFMHLQSYSRKANKGGQSVEQVLYEASRAPEFSKHVADPRPPSLVYGVAADEVRRLHDEMVAAGGVDVTLKDGRTARRGIRKDRHTLMTAVASYPLPTDLVNTKPDARADCERWRNHNLVWLKAQFGDKLVSVIEHWDEKHPHIHAYILPLDDPTCSARQLNPAWQAKEEAMEVARAAGHDDKAALKLGNAAYRAKARELQDDYFEQVSLPCGLTRTGPKRERLSRQQWRVRKDAARQVSALRREMDRRIDAIAQQQDELERAADQKAQELAIREEKAEAQFIEVQGLHAQIAQERDDMQHEAVTLLAAAEKEADNIRADAQQQVAAEVERYRNARHAVEQEKMSIRATTIKETAAVTVRVIAGVLIGSVRYDLQSRQVSFRDERLQQCVRELELDQVFSDVVATVSSLWSRLKNRLSAEELAHERQQAEEAADLGETFEYPTITGGFEP